MAVQVAIQLAVGGGFVGLLRPAITLASHGCVCSVRVGPGRSAFVREQAGRGDTLVRHASGMKVSVLVMG